MAVDDSSPTVSTAIMPSTSDSSVGQKRHAESQIQNQKTKNSRPSGRNPRTTAAASLSNMANAITESSTMGMMVSMMQMQQQNFQLMLSQQAASQQQNMQLII